MELLHYSERRRIRFKTFKTVWLIKPVNRADYLLWMHCTGSKQLAIPYKSYVARKLDRLLFMHGVGVITITEDKT